jgi:hypothetical protein
VNTVSLKPPTNSMPVRSGTCVVPLLDIDAD